METVKESADGVGGKEISQTGQSKSNLLNAEKTDNLLLSQLGGTSDSWLRQIVPMRENATTMSVIGKLTSCSVMSLGVMYLVWNSKRIIKQSSRRRRFGKKVMLSFICVGRYITERINSFHAAIYDLNFCCLLITFANSLDPDQDGQNIGPDLDPNSLTHW